MHQYSMACIVVLISCINLLKCLLCGIECDIVDLTTVLPECDYVTFGIFAIENPSVCLSVCLSSVTFMRPTQGLKLSAIFFRRFIP